MWRGGTVQIPFPQSCEMGRLPPCEWLSFLFPLAFPIEVQSLNDGILNLLRGRPRREEFADALFWNFELLLLIWLFLLHDGENHIHVQPPFL